MSQVDYLAVGFGAHHWRATTPTGARHFLALHELGHAGSSVDSLTAARAQLQRALGAARWLETSAELDFVVGPVPDVWSTCCRPVSDRFALALYPWLDCTPMRHPDDPRTADVLARLHAVAPRVPHGLGRTEDFRIPPRAQLDDALLGILLGGILGEQFGMNAAILVGVVGGLFSFVWLWRSPIRGLDAFPHPTQ